MLKYQVESNNAKMKKSLFLLILTGQCFFANCDLYEYRFVDKPKSWHHAQTYCRQNHTDLATVLDMTDLQRLRGWKGQTEAWIGLYSSPGKDNRTWHWSWPGLEFNKSTAKWQTGEPNDPGTNENCVKMSESKWTDVRCVQSHTFICYNETQTETEKFHHINKTMNWTQAQKYCREYYTDLISGPDQSNGSETRTTPWIGLFRDTWRWSDGSNSSLRHWKQGSFESGVDNEECAVMLNGSAYWQPHSCGEEKRFFCYDDKVVLVQQRLTWEQALYYCRDNYNDLVSITSARQQRWVQARAKNASTSHVWLGLRYTCTLDFWFWVSDEVVSYKNWAQEKETDDCDMSGAMAKDGDHKWFKMQDEEKFNFICSKD
ncbi:macrophage mannose receptor 1-like [Cheilinus undulatus]|uniref:macrophage mannose receptor 1-like n=1 Tax=Cheilinus undulatus TaxID=241271 RepID=UPI001BD5EB19|nr:macrophage mannose receptor 1-like [Cheilinus undulatus]